MSIADSNPWSPREFKRYVESFPTSTGVARVVTDAGEGYLKALGNREGPHALAREWLGTSLAKWIGLPTFDFTLIQVKSDDEIALGNGELAKTGTAFISRAEKGFTWGGDSEKLKSVVNSDIIPLLVTLDTLVLNVDRYSPLGHTRKPNYDNVFFVSLDGGGKKFRLVAMDYTHAFSCGTDLTSKIENIEFVQDKRAFGLFPQFIPFMNQAAVCAAHEKLAGLTSEIVSPIVEQLPDDWEVSAMVKVSLVKFLVQRADFMVRNLQNFLLFCDNAQTRLGI